MSVASHESIEDMATASEEEARAPTSECVSKVGSRQEKEWESEWMSMALLIVAAFAAAVAGMPFPVISGRLSANLLSHAVSVGVDVAVTASASVVAQRWRHERRTVGVKFSSFVFCQIKKDIIFHCFE